ncbi:MAG: DUF924 domain-containing protein [Gammaproteobacteria bacterium]|nr:DUF924 domain-containing protein [Gammaproteobacteria bacterium]
MTPTEIINYWYSDRISKHWFNSKPELDQEITDKYEKIWEQAATGNLIEWSNTPEGCLALVIILDQFPLNMYRGQVKSFSTEQQSVGITLKAIKDNFHKEFSQDKLSFLFIPLMHSENIEHQNLSVKLFTEFNLERNIRFAEHHRDLISRFGRFPHRNKILGRESTDKELTYLASKEAFTG